MKQKDYFGQDISAGLGMLLCRIAPSIVTVVTLALLVAAYGIDFSDEYKALMIISGLLALLLFRHPGRELALVSRKFWASAAFCFAVWALLFAIILLLGYASKTSAIYSRKIIFTWMLAAPIAITVTQYWIQRLMLRIAGSSTNRRKVIIAGANELGQSVAAKINNERRLGMSLLGFFDDRGIERLGTIPEGQLLGRLQDLPQFVNAQKVDLIFIALPIRKVQRVTELLDQLHDTTASIYFVPDVFVFELIQCRTDEIDGLPVVSLCETPFYGSRGVVKRLSDVVIASVILVLMSPVMLVIAIGVGLTTAGSIIFEQRRYGLDGHEIAVYKFRTMTVSDDDGDVRQATRNDSRTTRFGAFLRRYSLDELPQFLNVLQGRMSIVGPRPHAITHNEEYRKLIKGYMIRHKVCPGITGLAQIRGLRGETTHVSDMADRVEADLEYLRNWSLALDLRIIVRTVFLMFRDKAAY